MQSNGEIELVYENSWFTVVGYQPFPHLPLCQGAGCAWECPPDAPTATTPINPCDTPAHALVLGKAGNYAFILYRRV